MVSGTTAAARTGTFRAALETLALEANCERRMTGYQLRALLGIARVTKFDAFLKEHKVQKYTANDFEGDLATLQESAETQDCQRRYDADSDPLPRAYRSPQIQLYTPAYLTPLTASEELKQAIICSGR